MVLFFTEVEFAIQRALRWKQPSEVSGFLTSYFKVFIELVSLFITSYPMQNIGIKIFNMRSICLSFLSFFHLKSNLTFHSTEGRSFNPPICKRWCIYRFFWCSSYFSVFQSFSHKPSITAVLSPVLYLSLLPEKSVP